jgi:hypothetical protein
MPGVMKNRRMAIGGLLLPEDPAWDLSESDGEIVGRRGDDPGRLRIMHVAQNTLPQPVTHDFCLTVLRILAKTEEEPTDRQMMESVCGPYGAATFLRGREVVRAWYCRRPPGLIVGMYTCPAALARGPAYQFVSGQCAHMMAEVLFDRPSWDATDPLTQVLMPNFERLETERPDALC